jgi:hypothetical protein
VSRWRRQLCKRHRRIRRFSWTISDEMALRDRLQRAHAIVQAGIERAFIAQVARLDREVRLGIAGYVTVSAPLYTNRGPR